MPGPITYSSMAQRAADLYSVALSRYNTAYQQYSTGYRVNSAADDPTGAVQINSLQTRINGLTQAAANSSKASALVQAAKDGLSSMSSDLEDMLVIAQAVADDEEMSPEDRAEAQAQLEAAVAALDSTVSTTKYEGTQLLTGAFTNKTFQLGSNAGDTTTISIGDMSTAELGSDISEGGLGDLDVSTVGGANEAVQIIQSAIDTVSLQDATLTGVKTFVLDSNTARLTATADTLTDAMESIRDISEADATANLIEAESRLNASAMMVVHVGVMWQNAQTVLLGSMTDSGASASSLLSMLA